MLLTVSSIYCLIFHLEEYFYRYVKQPLLLLLLLLLSLKWFIIDNIFEGKKIVSRILLDLWIFDIIFNEPFLCLRWHWTPRWRRRQRRWGSPSLRRHSPVSLHRLGPGSPLEQQQWSIHQSRKFGGLRSDLYISASFSFCHWGVDKVSSWTTQR